MTNVRTTKRHLFLHCSFFCIAVCFALQFFLHCSFFALQFFLHCSIFSIACFSALQPWEPSMLWEPTQHALGAHAACSGSPRSMLSNVQQNTPQHCKQQRKKANKQKSTQARTQARTQASQQASKQASKQAIKPPAAAADPKIDPRWAQWAPMGPMGLRTKYDIDLFLKEHRGAVD